VANQVTTITRSLLGKPELFTQQSDVGSSRLPRDGAACYGSVNPYPYLGVTACDRRSPPGKLIIFC
jgi:hypothetical protein